MNRKEKMIQLKEEGKTYQEIGKIFGGVSRQRIHQIITGYRSPYSRLSYFEQCLRNPNIKIKNNKNSKIFYKDLKKRVIAHYSDNAMKCGYCGYQDIRSLEIDHMDNNGSKHRREILEKEGTGVFLYLWLIKNGFPKGFQVLCKNCNWIKYVETRKPKKLSTTLGLT